jgi:EAL domain-containing protein (putative c-di-GMP-specific phosphodiesterase class I)
MAEGMKLDLVAEGVENRTQLRYLHAKGCGEGQGYIFSKPVPAEDIAVMIRDNPFHAMVRNEAEQAVS